MLESGPAVLKLQLSRESVQAGISVSTISVLFGGRIAEEVFMNQMTTGASNDFERATADRPRHGHPLRHDR